MNNSQFLDILKNTFIRCLETHARSSAKLNILHGAISEDLYNLLKKENDSDFEVSSLGFGKGKEKLINGRYMDKRVDITISKNNQPIAGIAVKFVMSNYSQNSNNYFENMLGETANLRCNKIPYFQIFIIPDKVPYYDNLGCITKWERISEHNLEKYTALSKDNSDVYMHTPNKTLMYIVHLSEDKNMKTKKEYQEFYLNNPFILTFSENNVDFSKGIVYNDYELFIKKVAYTILGL
jgi:hypothetical protein